MPFQGRNSKKFCRYLWWRKLEVKGSESQSVMSTSSWTHKLYSPWNSLGQNTGVGSLSLLQGIFLTPGSNPGLPHCRQILYQLSHKGSPRVLEWVAYPFSSGSSWPREPTRVSCIADGFFTSWAIKEDFVLDLCAIMLLANFQIPVQTKPQRHDIFRSKSFHTRISFKCVWVSH